MNCYLVISQVSTITNPKTYNVMVGKTIIVKRCSQRLGYPQPPLIWIILRLERNTIENYYDQLIHLTLHSVEKNNIQLHSITVQFRIETHSQAYS